MASSASKGNTKFVFLLVPIFIQTKSNNYKKDITEKNQIVSLKKNSLMFLL